MDEGEEDMERTVRTCLEQVAERVERKDRMSSTYAGMEAVDPEVHGIPKVVEQVVVEEREEASGTRTRTSAPAQTLEAQTTVLAMRRLLINLRVPSNHTISIIQPPLIF